MPGEKRKVPLEPRDIEPEEWDALGLLQSEVVISKAFEKPSGTQPAPAITPSKPRPKPPKPSSKNT
jgi:hypothetical protein